MAWLTVNFNSEALHMPVMLDALIPQGHGNYKTLYLLHGAGGDHTSWVNKSRIADYVEGQNIAVIMPSGNNRCYVNNRHGKNYYSFVAEELVKKCENWFSLDTNPESRYIAGMSMGGYGAFYAALEKKGQYAAAFSYSGLLNILERYDKPQGMELFPVFGTREELIAGGFDLFQKVEQNKNNVENRTQFLISCGKDDSRIEMSRQFYEKIKTTGYSVSYLEEPGGHDWDYWDTCIRRTIKWIAADGQAAEGRNTWQS